MRRVASGSMTTTELAAVLRIERARLKVLVEAGVLGKREGRGESRHHDWFSRADYNKARAFLEGRTHAAAWGKQVGASPSVVQQFLALGMLRTSSDDLTESVYCGPQLDAGSKDQFCSNLQSNICFSSNVEDWRFLGDVFVMVGNCHKPWGPILQAAITGMLPYGLRSDGPYRIKLGDLRIHRVLAWDIRMRALYGGNQIYRVPAERYGHFRPLSLTRTECERYLNCYPSDVSNLIKLGALRMISKSPASICAISVEKFGMEYVSTREVSSMLKGLYLEARFKSDFSWSRHYSSFWRRDELYGANGMLQALREENGFPSRVVIGPGLDGEHACRSGSETIEDFAAASGLRFRPTEGNVRIPAENEMWP